MMTVIYYTSNREDEKFEEKIRANLLSVIGDLPLISVSQKPIDFGQNICVGDVGISDANIFRQLMIGCEAAKTPLIATAESDCIYPPTGYFDFVPEDKDMAYRYTNLYVLQMSKKGFWKKDYSLCGQVSGREYLIKWITRRLKKEKVTTWTTSKLKIKDFFPLWKNFKLFSNELPIINIKTGKGLRRSCKTSKDFTDTLPYFGHVSNVVDDLF